MSKLTNEFKTAEAIVSKILAENPLCRDSFLELLLSYWQSEGVELTTFQVNHIRLLLNPETIRRSSQRVQNTYKLYEPSKRAKKARIKKEQEMHEVMKPIRYEYHGNVATPIYQ